MSFASPVLFQWNARDLKRGYWQIRIIGGLIPVNRRKGINRFEELIKFLQLRRIRRVYPRIHLHPREKNLLPSVMFAPRRSYLAAKEQQMHEITTGTEIYPGRSPLRFYERGEFQIGS